MHTVPFSIHNCIHCPTFGKVQCQVFSLIDYKVFTLDPLDVHIYEKHALISFSSERNICSNYNHLGGDTNIYDVCVCTEQYEQIPL